METGAMGMETAEQLQEGQPEPCKEAPVPPHTHSVPIFRINCDHRGPASRRTSRRVESGQEGTMVSPWTQPLGPGKASGTPQGATCFWAARALEQRVPRPQEAADGVNDGSQPITFDTLWDWRGVPEYPCVV